MERKNNGFFIYNNYIEPAYKVLPEKDFKDFATALILYGTTGSYPPVSFLAEIFLLQIIPFVDKYDRRYTYAKQGGNKGGRKPVVTNKEIKCAILNNRFSSSKELSEYFHCSKRTIARHISQKEILETYEESKSKSLL